MQSENPWYVTTAELAEMLFPEAGELWLASRTPYISPKTFHEYELNLRTLGKAFEETKLREITADQIRMYSNVPGDANQSEMWSVGHQSRNLGFAAIAQKDWQMARNRTPVSSFAIARQGSRPASFLLRNELGYSGFLRA